VLVSELSSVVLSFLGGIRGRWRVKGNVIDGDSSQEARVVSLSLS